MPSTEESQGGKQSPDHGQEPANDQPETHRTPIGSPVQEETPTVGETGTDKSPGVNSEPPKTKGIENDGLPQTSPVQNIQSSSIRASSTPKDDNRDVPGDDIAGEIIIPKRSPRHVRANSILRDEDLQNEMTPLLESEGSESYVALEEGLHRQLQASSRSRGVYGWFTRTFCSTPWLSWLVLTLMVIILLILLLVARNLPMLLDQAFVSQLHSVSVLDINDSGLTVHVVGSTYVDYENISSRFYGKALKVIALFIGGVTVVPHDASRVFVSGQGIKRAHALNVYPPDISVDLIDHRLTEYDFISDALFIQDSLPGIVEDLMKHNRSTPLPVTVEIDFTSDITTKWLHFSTGLVNIHEDTIISPERMASPLTVETIDLDLHNDGVALNGTLILEALPMKLALDSVDWDVAIADCDGKPSHLGVWNSAPFTIAPNKLTVVNVGGTIPRVPQHLLEPCKDGQTPFNKFVVKISNEGHLDVFISAAKTLQNSQNLPRWLYNILTSVDVNIDIPVESQGGLSMGNMLTSVEITSMDVEFLKASSGELHLNTSCEFNASMVLPILKNDFEANLSEWTSSVDIHDGNATVGTASTVLSSGLAIKSEHGNTTSIIGVLKRWEAKISDGAYFGDLFSGWINEQNSKRLPSLDADIEQVKIESGFLNTTLENLSIKNIKFGREFELAHETSGEAFFDWLLREMNISISTIQLIQSGKSWVHFGIEAEISNPLPLNLQLNEEQLAFAFLFEDVEIGNVTFDSLSIPRTSKRTRVPAHIKVSCSNFEERNAAEKFVSLVLSGATNITVGAHGKSVDGHSGIGKMMERIQIPEIALPRLTFAHPEDDSSKSNQELAHGSPFLIEAIIHILTSEVELLVFNPVTNQQLIVDLLSCQAIYEGQVLAFADNAGVMSIPPGIFHTKRIPYKVGSGMGGDILRRTLNGELQVIVKSDMMVQVDNFTGQVLLQIKGVTAKVRL
ncbi:hypothetical protein FT663_00402 [Candidozyma haemuli var. vulneris]|uniref:Tag1-like fifth Ig-like domain-containing protein n=1 Tax=Candidozyma haemuli TaxID=45357 RepID=A0A2V1AU43_9ASCO|nr:hypothetical protein CXQ85_000630 [[Candida] haemuloni]KAF3988812.1 hypothetical protein FT662_03190 [[Candida] haemuloni var. vulneris]KAF3995511.1 hypothetical protein FT663_00402 [[Candida] haemuloni var. vulneris]PVH21647.1 hypothetical protein CXQ85_000630 [[Candida] haemuloni]